MTNYTESHLNNFTWDAGFIGGENAFVSKTWTGPSMKTIKGLFTDLVLQSMTVEQVKDVNCKEGKAVKIGKYTVRALRSKHGQIFLNRIAGDMPTGNQEIEDLLFNSRIQSDANKQAERDAYLASQQAEGVAANEF